jgi:hypothetical protein
MGFPTVRGDVEWLLDNVLLQQEDVRFAEQNVATPLYLDAADVRDAVVGLQAFYTDHGFDESLYKSDRALVCALAASGWLGPFQMLPPHEAEFLGLLSKDFHLHAQEPWNELIERFLNDVGIAHEFDFTAETLKHLTQAQLAEFVRKQAGRAQDFFKALHSLNGNWTTRLVRWHRTHLLQISDQRAEYGDVIASGEFEALRQELTRHRPLKPHSNFADAAALCLLIQSVDRFNAGGSALPRFFPSALLRSVVEEVGLADRFTYKRSDGSSASVFCDRDYFVFRATYRPPPHVILPVDGAAELQKLRSELELIQCALNVPPEMLERRRASEKAHGRLLKETLRDLRAFQFLERVWLGSAAVFEAKQVAANLVEMATTLDASERFRNGLREALDTTKRALNKNATDYVRVKHLWEGLDGAARRLRRPGELVQPDTFKLYGLVRFAVDPLLEEPVRQTLAGLLSEQDAQVRAERAKVIEAFRAPVFEPRFEGAMISGGAVLWAAKAFELIVELLPRETALHSVPLSVLCAVAATETERNQETASDLVDLLEIQYKMAHSPRVAIALAYLAFHKWRWMARRQYIGPSALVMRAIEYARSAAETLEEGTEPMVYALNQFLYYSIESRLDGRDDDIDAAADRLAAMKKRNAAVWQYRYDDTLARYFLWLAEQQPDQVRREEMTLQAVAHGRMAMDSGGAHDEEVTELMTRASMELARLRRKRAPSGARSVGEGADSV